jgi:hypothetical protein
MNNEQIRKIIADSYDDSKEETLRKLAGEFYSRRFRSAAILAWIWGILFFALAAYSAVRFFKEGQVREQIMYAALFTYGALSVGLMKIFAWQIIHRFSIKRDLKRLELSVAELSQMLKGK